MRVLVAKHEADVLTVMVTCGRCGTMRDIAERYCPTCVSELAARIFDYVPEPQSMRVDPC